MAPSFMHERAARLHEEGQELSSSGNDAEALRRYHQALTLEPDRPTTLYNIGLIHKYRSEWRESFDYNLRSYELRPDDEATRWNLAIAATALRDWETARRIWQECGLELDGQSGPISMNFGMAPVRLNPNSEGEVVWGTRIDPVRTILSNVPLPESGFRYQDIVLHDGAPVGSRVVSGREYGVFNVLELFEPSRWNTYRAVIDATNPEALASLERLAENFKMGFEDWTGSLNILCRACSEGTPHEHTEQDSEWIPHRRIGLSAKERNQIDQLLQRWTDQEAGNVEAVTLELQAEEAKE
jgi:tetratricopeptide (TPR) repeat protein